VTKHDNWDNYERAVEEATDAWLAIGRAIDADDREIPAEIVPLMVRAEYALADAVSALQEAQTWSKARSALLFWDVRYAAAAEYVQAARAFDSAPAGTGGNFVFGLARELELSDAQLRFVLAELAARLVAFREIRPQSAGSAARILYLEHSHA
jgi:hypothetical protein